MKRYTFVLNFGYVEEAAVGYLPFTSRDSFANAKKALVNLAEYLRDEFMKTITVEPKACCVNTREKDNEALYCSKCRMSLTNLDFDSEEFMQWLRDLNGCTNDSWPIDWDAEAPWEVGHLEDAPNPRFVYQAEWVLSAAVGHPYHDEIEFKDICAKRTKEKKESFSYY